MGEHMLWIYLWLSEKLFGKNSVWSHKTLLNSWNYSVMFITHSKFHKSEARAKGLPERTTGRKTCYWLFFNHIHTGMLKFLEIRMQRMCTWTSEETIDGFYKTCNGLEWLSIHIKLDVIIASFTCSCLCFWRRGPAPVPRVHFLCSSQYCCKRWWSHCWDRVPGFYDRRQKSNYGCVSLKFEE